MKKLLFSNLVFSLMISTICFSDTINVPADQPSIQAGIDAAVNGDTVLVADGTYAEEIDFNGKAITVRGENGAESTTIRGYAATVVTFQSRETADSVLEGFSIENGQGAAGGGVLCKNSSPFIADCIIKENWALNGGGMCNIFSSPTVTNCTFENNSTLHHGSGVFNEKESSPTFIKCSFNKNETANGLGGGMYNLMESSPVLKYCLFTENSAGDGGGGMYSVNSTPDLSHCDFVSNEGELGGGVWNDCCSPVFTHCTFAQNAAEEGGGMYNAYSKALLTSCTFYANEAYEGGALNNNFFADVKLVDCRFIENSAFERGVVLNGLASWPEFVGCVFSGNSAFLYGSAVFSRSACPTFTNCTFTGNEVLYSSGAAIHTRGVNSRAVFTNCIVYGNDPVEIKAAGGQTIVSYSNVRGGYSGTGNIDAEPLFVDAGNHDVHLTVGSPCRDSGDGSAAGLPDYDFEGDPRIHDGFVDMGADEFHPHLYVVGDVNPGSEVECKFIGHPGSVPAGLFIGSGLLFPYVEHTWGSFYMEAPWYFFPLVPIPAEGVLVMPAVVPSTPVAPYHIFLQALINMELSNYFVLEVVQ
ncbi:MAG: right-handed parallel beta-helix repeat-containing protein [Planctomycetota bacterium]